MKNAFSIAIALLVSGAALTYALWDVNFDALVSLLAGGNYWSLIPFTVLLALYYWLKALRWAVLLRPLGHFKWFAVTPSMMVGFAGNNLLPAHLGELLRTVVFGRQFHKPWSGVFSTLLLERVIDVIAILSIYFAAVMTLGSAPEALESAAWIAAAAIGLVCGVIGLVLGFEAAVHGIWTRVSAKLPERWQRKGGRIVANAILALSSLKSPQLTAMSLFYSVAQWSVMGLLVWVSLWAYGAAVSVGVCMIVVAVLALAVTVPSAPGYVGAIQAAFVFALAPFGISEEIAFAASVLFLVAQWIPVTAIGMLCFASQGLDFTEARKQLKEAKEAGNAT